MENIVKPYSPVCHPIIDLFMDSCPELGVIVPGNYPYLFLRDRPMNNK